MIGLAHLWRAVRAWALALLALVTAGAWAYLLGRRRGARGARAQERAKQAAKDATNAAAAAQTQAHDAQRRHDIGDRVAALHDADAQKVATADPDSAAGRLREDGWSR